MYFKLSNVYTFQYYIIMRFRFGNKLKDLSLAALKKRNVHFIIDWILVMKIYFAR